MHLVNYFDPNSISSIFNIIIATAAALRGVTIQSARARAAFPTTRTFPRLPTPLNQAAAAAAVGQLHGYTPYVLI